MKNICFDLGDTLVEYEGLPPSWEDHYPEALRAMALDLGKVPSDEQIANACRVLRQFNTRLFPRTDEVRFMVILEKLFPELGIPMVAALAEERASRAFFSVFRRRLRCFPDTLPALQRLRAQGCRIGVFTDVPYGMPVALVEEDVALAGLYAMVDVLICSPQVGKRKPAKETLAFLASELKSDPADMLYVGNEEKDIRAAKNFGCAALLLDRAGENPEWGQDRSLRTLSEVETYLAGILVPGR